jgi:preprotein translocase subunit SecF
VVALLTVVGYSINDTVVIFDRIRENLAKKVGIDFADTVNKSLLQAFARSLNTSLTTLFVVLAIFFFGGETLRYFALAMGIGIVAGSYSSLFLAPFLLAKLAARKGG